eukprot:Pgem_evm1s17784
MRKHWWRRGVVIIVDAMNTTNQGVEVARSVKSYQEIVVVRTEIFQLKEGMVKRFIVL